MNFKSFINWLSLFANLSDRIDVHVKFSGSESVKTFHIDDFFSDSAGSAFLKNFATRPVKSFLYLSMENNPYVIYI